MLGDDLDLTLEHKSTDVLVLGGGLAGYRAAIAARDLGAGVIIAYRGHGASPHVIGFNAAIGAVDARDGPGVFFDDMVRGGYGLNDRSLVRILAEESVQAYEELLALGVPFAHRVDAATGERKPLQRHLSGNTYARSVFIAEGTGRALMQALAARARTTGIEMIGGQKIVDLLRDRDAVVGALLWKPYTNTLTAVRARAVVMAMGGIGQLYAGSTYPADVCADAFGMALEAGASLIDMEFVQFEPVVTVWPQECRGMEMPTAMLGDGAHLKNALGERFMLERNPPLGERGIEKAKMALHIQREIDEGRGLPQGGVVFDTTVLSSEQLESYVSHCSRLRRAGVDPAVTSPIVAPAAHSIMGGIAIDARGWTGVPGLYAGGESAGGVHGASRLAGNGCADTLVFGAVAGRGAAGSLQASARRDWSSIEGEAIARLEMKSGDAAGDTDAVKAELRDTLARCAGIWRDAESLAEGARIVDGIRNRLRDGRAADIASVIDLGEARRMADTARVVLGAALARQESRGAHQRTDFREMDDSRWLHHVSYRREADGELVQAFRPIQ
jgi:succinate dehydrogenase/fumarate reductase flavoprotein subunit